jgi:hypothetical protein
MYDVLFAGNLNFCAWLPELLMLTGLNNEKSGILWEIRWRYFCVS